MKLLSLSSSGEFLRYLHKLLVKRISKGLGILCFSVCESEVYFGIKVPNSLPGQKRYLPFMFPKNVQSLDL